MTPEADAFLDKAREFLAKARSELEILHYADEAGRAAYLAGLHAAQALIFERTGKVVRRHGGVQSELHRQTRDEPRFAPELRAFLGRTYNLKAIADYETGSDAEVTVGRARDAIATADRFLRVIVELLHPPDGQGGAV